MTFPDRTENEKEPVERNQFCVLKKMLANYAYYSMLEKYFYSINCTENIELNALE